MTAEIVSRTMPGYTLPKRKQSAIAGSFRGLMAAVINRALADLKKNRKVIKASDHVRDEAMAWINSPECEAFCYALDTDYRAIREQAAALYRRFLERTECREKAPLKSGAGAGKSRPMTGPESQPQSIRRSRTAIKNKPPRTVRGKGWNYGLQVF